MPKRDPCGEQRLTVSPPTCYYHWLLAQAIPRTPKTEKMTPLGDWLLMTSLPPCPVPEAPPVLCH